MFPALSLAIPPQVLVRLLQKLEAAGGERDLGELAVQLLAQWLATPAGTPAQGEKGMPAEPPGGFLWKEVFLPNGTVLRGFGNSTAVVRDGQLLHQGGAAGRPPEPRSDPGEPVMIISRERRKHHARRVTDSIWDE